MSLIQKIIDKLYREPRDFKIISEKYGGKENYMKILQGEAEMRKFAINNLEFPDLEILNYKPSINLNLLTGEKFIHQALFCAYSFLKHLSKKELLNYRINIFDDGSLNENAICILKSKSKNFNVISKEESLSKVEKLLPHDKFPFIHKKLMIYPIIKKMIYTHINNKGINPILDSDMLFVKRPDYFINWLNNYQSENNETFFIQDCQRCYGYSDNLINKLAIGIVPEKINGGLYSFNSEKFSFDRLENYIHNLELAEGKFYYLEQALIAIISSEYKNQIIASSNDYIVFPTKEQILNQEGVLQHYVDISKEWYFKEAWRKII